MGNPLENYFKILEGREKTKFLKCENLDEKIKESENIMQRCHFCERKCNVNRKKGERGYCRVLDSKSASEFIHLGEEHELIPSHTIFFSGCTFSCIFCQNWDISQFPDSGVFLEEKILAKIIKDRKEKSNSRNVNWVGGDPTPNLAYILKVLSHLKKLNLNVPQVWNSNMYLSEDAMNLLDGVIDVYLTDFKYGNDECAKKLSNVKNYFEITKRNHLIAEKQGEMIIRHLVLPNHLECCAKPILKWISENLKNFRINIMEQYRPEYKAMEFSDINRRLSWDEFNEAIKFAKELGIKIWD